MIVHVQYNDVALMRCHLISTYLSHSVLSWELDNQVVSWSHDLPWVKGKTAQDGAVGGQIINNQEGDILSNLLRVVTNHYWQSDRTEGMYSCSSESDEGCINWDQPLSINCYLLERWVVKDVSKAPIIHQDPMGVVVPYSYVNY